MSRWLCQLCFFAYVSSISSGLEYPVAMADSSKSTVVARVESEGSEALVTEARLLNYCAENPDKAVATCLQDLIEFELLAMDAARRGLVESPSAQRATHQAIVRLYLGEDFATEWTAESMPGEYVEQAYQKNYTMFNKPASREADHVITTIGSKRPSDPAVDQKAQELAQAIYEDFKARPPKDRDEFMARGADWMNRAQTEGFEARAQPLGRFSQNGRYAKSFTDVVFGYDGDGEVIPPFATEFGHHVVRIEKSHPAIARPLDEVETEIRARITDQVRGQKFKELTNNLASQYEPINDDKGVNGLMNVIPLFALEKRKGLDASETTKGTNGQTKKDGR